MNNNSIYIILKMYLIIKVKYLTNVQQFKYNGILQPAIKNIETMILELLYIVCVLSYVCVFIYLLLLIIYFLMFFYFCCGVVFVSLDLVTRPFSSRRCFFAFFPKNTRFFKLYDKIMKNK